MLRSDTADDRYGLRTGLTLSTRPSVTISIWILLPGASSTLDRLVRLAPESSPSKGTSRSVSDGSSTLKIRNTLDGIG